MSKARVLIVGGGPAGISTALFLAHREPRLARDIVVLEKARYPREKFCAGAVGARADRLLASIGVVVDVPSAKIGGIAFRALGTTLAVREADAGRVVRRVEFDHALSRIAVERGIAVRDGVRVERVEPHADGVRVFTDQGLVEAEVVVGADGVGSLVRRCLGVAPTPFHAQAIEVDTEPLEDDVAGDLLLFDVNDRSLNGYYWDFPTVVGGRRMVCRGVYYLRSDGGAPVEIRDVLARRLHERGLSLSDYRIKRFAERGFSRTGSLSAPRVLLVGEAAGIDPVTGEGIAQAIQYGAVAGGYLARKLSLGELAFADWRREVDGTMIGRDLRIRSRAVPLFYGPFRARTERFVLDTPDFMKVGLQYFAGRRWSRPALVRGTFAALKAAAVALATTPATGAVPAE